MISPPAGGPANQSERRLPCGRGADAAWQHAADGLPDDHERQCPYCTAVREQYESLAAASAAYTAAPITAPPGLIDTVMRTVLVELRPGTPISLPSTTGTAHIASTALATAVRSMLDRDPAVITYRCVIDTADEPGTPSVLPRAGLAPLTVRLSVSVSYEHYSRHRDGAVRERVIDTVHSLFGRHVGIVDIDIIDVFATDGVAVTGEDRT